MALEERLQLPLLLSSGLVLAARQKITRRCCWGEGEGGKVAGHLLEPEARSREDVAAIAASIRTGQDTECTGAGEEWGRRLWAQSRRAEAHTSQPVVSLRSVICSAPGRGDVSISYDHLVVIQAVGSSESG